MLRTLMCAWPSAPVYALVYDAEAMGSDFAGRDIRTSRFQRSGFLVQHYKWLLPWIDGAYRRFELDGFDVVLSDASGWSKSVRKPPGAVHVCYCHTPTRYLWSSADTYIDETGYPRPLKWAFRRLLGRLRRKDLRAAAGVDVFVANSEYVAARIKRYYGRESTVVHPPVDIAAFRPAPRKSDYLLVVTRLVPYKRVELAIAAANRLGRPLKVMGDGPDRARLERLAGPTVEFLGRVDDAARGRLFAEAAALLNPQEEDFGITMVEALASGTPVIAYAAGGAVEIVDDGETGILFAEPTEESLVEAITRGDAAGFDPELLRQRAEVFSETRFIERMRKVVEAARRGAAA